MWEKLEYTYETNNFAINYSWVYMISHFWLYGSFPIRKVTKKFENFPALSYKIQKKCLAPIKKHKDKNTD